jgi:hypothetical protein
MQSVLWMIFITALLCFDELKVLLVSLSLSPLKPGM